MSCQITLMLHSENYLENSNHSLVLCSNHIAWPDLDSRLRSIYEETYEYMMLPNKLHHRTSDYVQMNLKIYDSLLLRQNYFMSLKKDV